MNIQGFSQAQKLAMIRLSTAQRINSAADDPAGLAISEQMRGQIRGESVATRNMHDSYNMLQTAEGALGTTHSVLQRMRELAVQANNGTLSGSDRGMIQQEFSQLRDTIDYIGKNTQFNTKNLLDGSFEGVHTTTGANGKGVETSINSALANQLGDAESGITLADLNLDTDPSKALKVIDGAIAQISDSRSSIGATQNRLHHTINVSQTQHYNMQASESRIRDLDMAKGIVELNRANVLQETYFATQKMQQGMMGQMLNFLF